MYLVLLFFQLTVSSSRLQFDYETSYTFRCDNGYHATKPGDVERHIKCVDPESTSKENLSGSKVCAIVPVYKDLSMCYIH